MIYTEYPKRLKTKVDKGEGEGKITNKGKHLIYFITIIGKRADTIEIVR
jgi:hypothetical protein